MMKLGSIAFQLSRPSLEQMIGPWSDHTSAGCRDFADIRPMAEVFFPNLDEDENFFVSSDSGDVATESGYTIRFVTYENKNPKAWG